MFVPTECNVESYGSKSFRGQNYRSFDKRHSGFDKQKEYLGEMTCSNTV